MIVRIFMAATVLVAAPCPARADPPTPMQFEFPREIGAAPRPVDPDMVVRFRHTTFEVLNACGRPLAGQVTVGCVAIDGNICVVLLPPAEALTLEDLLHIEAHELRHCTGQTHVTETGPDGKKLLRWLP